MTTAAERLVFLSGLSGVSAGQHLLALASGSTSGAILVNYSGLPTGTAAEHLLQDHAAQVAETISGGWPVGQRHKTDDELRDERIRLGIIEQEKAQLEQEAAQVSQKRPKQGTERDYQSRLYLALLNEQIAALGAQEALLLAHLRALEYQAIEETDMVFVMMMMAEA